MQEHVIAVLQGVAESIHWNLGDRVPLTLLHDGGAGPRLPTALDIDVTPNAQTRSGLMLGVGSSHPPDSLAVDSQRERALVVHGHVLREEPPQVPLRGAFQRLDVFSLMQLFPEEALPRPPSQRKWASSALEVLANAEHQAV